MLNRNGRQAQHLLELHEAGVRVLLRCELICLLEDDDIGGGTVGWPKGKRP